MLAMLAKHCGGNMDHGIQRVVNFEGYYLDGEEASSVPREPVYQSHKLDSLEAEAKYTDNRTMVRLTGRYQIKSVTLLVSRFGDCLCAFPKVHMCGTVYCVCACFVALMQSCAVYLPVDVELWNTEYVKQ